MTSLTVLRRLARYSPVLPLIGGGKTLLQPVYVGDVARAVVEAVNGDLGPGSVWELGGMEKLTFRQCMDRMQEVIGRQRGYISLPFAIAKSMGGIAQFAPGAPITPGQVEMLKTDNVVSDEFESDKRTLQGMGIAVTSLDSVLPKYLVRFRKHGQFEANRGL